MALRTEARGIKRERAPVTASKIQLPSTFKCFERTYKENVVPGLEVKLNVLKEMESTPIKTARTSPKLGTLKKMKSASRERFIRKHLVKDKMMEIFPASFDADLKTLMEKKVKAGKFEYAARNNQQGEIIKELKDMVTELIRKKNLFSEDCIKLEEKAESDFENFRTSVHGELNEKELLQDKLQDSLNKLEANAKELQTLQSQSATLTEELEHVNGKNSQLSCAARGTERELELLKVETEELKASLGVKADQLEKVQEQLDSAKRQMAEEQVTARGERAVLEKALNERLEATKLQFFEASKRAEAATKEKISLAEQVAKLEVLVQKATGEAQRSEAFSLGLQSQIKSLEQQVMMQKDAASAQAAQTKAMLDNFTQTQAFNEGHHKEVTAELHAHRQKVDALLETKSKLEKELNSTASAFQESSRHLQEASAKLDSISQELSAERAGWAEARALWQEKEMRISGELSSAQENWKQQKAQQVEHEKKLVAERDEERERARQSHNELLTYQANSGVSNTEQLQSLCKAQMENAVLRQQLEGKDNLALTLVEKEHSIRDLKEKLYQGELTRRELHNKIQELRGSIRVIVRVRPFLKHDAEQGPCALEFNPNGQSVSMLADDSANFTFDQVFPTTSTQEHIFGEVTNLVQSALDGFNVCLFSYGQTGSGKTHTMQGTLAGPGQGIIPRAIAKVMEEARRLGGQGWSYTFEGTYVEIYNEQLRDLLGDSRSSTNLEIKMDPNNLESVYVPGLTRMPITEAGQIEGLISLATKHRAVAGTDMNEHSSRSHAVFTLFIVGTNKEQDVVVEGSLNLCDLAGSERLSKSGATGERLKETQAINKSLSSLGDVFQALQSRSSHIPYRNSKLTYLLSPCFSGQGKTLMFVNLSPLVSSQEETISSLRFASKVAACELGGKQLKNVKKIACPAPTPVSGVKRSIPAAAPRPRPGAR